MECFFFPLYYFSLRLLPYLNSTISRCAISNFEFFIIQAEWKLRIAWLEFEHVGKLDEKENSRRGARRLLKTYGIIYQQKICISTLRFSELGTTVSFLFLFLSFEIETRISISFIWGRRLYFKTWLEFVTASKYSNKILPPGPQTIYDVPYTWTIYI